MTQDEDNKIEKKATKHPTQKIKKDQPHGPNTNEV
jgi:hypothetical protein